jgi:hypothetical protein
VGHGGRAAYSSSSGTGSMPEARAAGADTMGSKPMTVMPKDLLQRATWPVGQRRGELRLTNPGRQDDKMTRNETLSLSFGNFDSYRVFTRALRSLDSSP